MRVAGARHGEGAAYVFTPVVGLVLDGRTGGFFLHHIGAHAAALNHEAVDHPVEHGVGVEAVRAVLLEIFRRFRRVFEVEGEADEAEAGDELNHLIVPASG